MPQGRISEPKYFCTINAFASKEWTYTQVVVTASALFFVLIRFADMGAQFFDNLDFLTILTTLTIAKTILETCDI